MFRVLLVLLLPSIIVAQAEDKPLRAVTDPGVVTTRQSITSAGAQAVFQGRVYGIAFGATVDEVWVLNAGHALRLNWKNNQVLDRVAIDGSPGLQGIQFDPDSGRAYVSSTQNRKVKLLEIDNGRSKIVAEGIGDQIAGGVGLAKEATAVVPLIYNNRLAIVDIAQRRTRTSAVTGIAPFGAAVNTQGTVAYVSNWGGRLPKAGDLTARTGLLPTA